jgi:hypothetical protein
MITPADGEKRCEIHSTQSGARLPAVYYHNRHGPAKG